MRLDAHIHVYGYDSIEKLKAYVRTEGITHIAASLYDRNLDLIERLDESGARGIPFRRLEFKNLPRLGDSPYDAHVAGFKLHPRKGNPTDDGTLFTASPERLGDLCKAAGSAGKPLLFHTDADEPYPCTLPMLADLAQRYPNTTLIAAHLGVYTHEFYVKEYTPQEWEPMVEPLFRENLQMLLDIDNLYGETARFGSDWPTRSPDPEHRIKIFSEVVGGFTRAQRKKLLSKIFVGTDFPCFYEPITVANIDLGPIYLRTTYRYQANCLREVFQDDFDEDQMVENFLKLLPESHGDRYR